MFSATRLHSIKRNIINAAAAAAGPCTRGRGQNESLYETNEPKRRGGPADMCSADRLSRVRFDWKKTKKKKNRTWILRVGGMGFWCVREQKNTAETGDRVRERASEWGLQDENRVASSPYVHKYIYRTFVGFGITNKQTRRRLNSKQ